MSRGKPVTIRGVEYPSRKAAAKALGVSQATISGACERGTLDNVGLQGGGPIPVTTKGMKFPSKTAACNHFDISFYTLEEWLDQGI
ncbi:NUMOD1 domain-containing DNA-binding protein [Pseudooceanicola nitratireducens]|uniref:NUMOD1 domain-containing DNA-binding protein n=1 Tax=Pseudooceanicola nitratireducens TaxID=517719 RepID=UPI003C7B19E8